jgi:hypothetical protein
MITFFEYSLLICEKFFFTCSIHFLDTQAGYIETLHPKFRLTFYICSLGFASSILFDEQKRPYHLMLQRFDQSGGLKSLFDAFHWALSLLTPATSTPPGPTDPDGLNSQLDRDKLQEGNYPSSLYAYVVPAKTNSALFPLPLLPRYHRVHRGLATAHPKASQHQEHARDPPLAHHALLCGRRRKPDRRSETRVFLRSHQVPLQGPQRVLPGAHVPLGQQVVHNPRELLALRDSSQHPVSDTGRRQSTAEKIRRATGLGSSWGSGYSKPDRQQQYQQYRVQSSFVASSFHSERARCQSSIPGSYAGRLCL